MHRNQHGKQFSIRDSSMSVALNDKCGKCVYNIVVSGLAVLALRNAVEDIWYDGGSLLGFRLIYEGFKDLDITFVAWILLLVIHLNVYFGWHIWAWNCRGSKAWHIFWVLVAATAFLGPMYFVAQLCPHKNISLCCRAILWGEQIRFAMKGYAFIRRKSEEIRDKDEFIRPNFGHYLYYTFAPTLVYRNSYPRKTGRNWKVMLKLALEFFVALYASSVIEEMAFIKPLKNFGRRPFTKVDILHFILICAPFALLQAILVLQYMGLHLVQIFFAELLQFGDCMTFGEWWTSKDPSEVMRKWNIVVQDWLYEYVYKDVYTITKNKTSSALAVLLLSAIFHEFPFVNILKITCPVFAVAMLSYFSKDIVPKSNFTVFVGMLLGHSWTITVLHLEYFAKSNCPTQVGLLYTPKLFSCSWENGTVNGS